jgi:predicted phosphate transport protein (TIGR00153 family)
MFNFKPKDDMFFQLFSKGIEISNAAAKGLRQLMKEFDNPKQRLEELTKLEHQGDQITHDLVEHTKKMFITPLDREDIYNITKCIDRITDNIESTAYRFFMYNITKPTDETILMLDKLVEATDELVIAISQMKTLKSDLMLQKIIDVNKIENDADLIYRKAVKKLFDNPDDLLGIVKWKDIYKYLEDGIDSCEMLANELQGVVMKYA